MLTFPKHFKRHLVTSLATLTATIIFGVSTPGANEQAVSPRIVGGSNIDIGLIPSSVALLNTDRFNAGKIPRNAQFCGGTLIQKRWVLTAAHYVTNFANGTMIETPAEDILVLAGVTDLTVSPPPVTPISVVSVNVHKEWLLNNVALGNDIALLELSSDSNAPIAQLDTQEIKLNDVALVGGWGALDAPVVGQSQTFPTSLQGVVVYMVPYDQCDTIFPLQQSLTGITVQPTQLCAGVDGGGQNPCHGDSGGAIYRVDASLAPDSIVPVSVVGIVSFGASCAPPGYPEVFTDVQAYAGFINDTISKSTVTTTNPTDPVDPTNPVDPASVDDAVNTDSGSGCSIGGQNPRDPLLPLLVLLSICFFLRRRPNGRGCDGRT